MRARAEGGDAIRRFETVARILTGDGQAAPEDGVRWIAELVRRLEIPLLRTYGITQKHVPGLVEKAARASSMNGNPVVLAEQELTEIVQRAL